MGWLDLSRVPEPEVMDDSAEVEAYASAAAQAYLDKVDDTFVDHALRLVRDRETGRALDVGTGPGQILLKLAGRLPGWRFIGVDRSPHMIAQARRSAAELALGHPDRTAGCEQGTSATGERVQFLVADGNRLDFAEGSFDFVLCNSVLHHLADPQQVLGEMARVARPGAAILIRDLRRPSRLAFPLHVRWYGRHYSGLMYTLYCDSVRAAYTLAELEDLLCRAPLPAGTRVFRHARTHIGIERPLGGE